MFVHVAAVSFPPYVSEISINIQFNSFLFIWHQITTEVVSGVFTHGADQTPHIWMIKRLTEPKMHLKWIPITFHMSKCDRVTMARKNIPKGMKPRADQRLNVGQPSVSTSWVTINWSINQSVTQTGPLQKKQKLFGKVPIRGAYP